MEMMMMLMMRMLRVMRRMKHGFNPQGARIGRNNMFQRRLASRKSTKSARLCLLYQWAKDFSEYYEQIFQWSSQQSQTDAGTLLQRLGDAPLHGLGPNRPPYGRAVYNCLQ